MPAVKKAHTRTYAGKIKIVMAKYTKGNKPKPAQKPRGSSVTRANFSVAEKEKIKTLVAHYYVRGFSSYGIMQEIKKVSDFNVGLKSIGGYIEDILDDWHASRINDVDRMITGELMKLLKVEREAWDAWERSKLPSIKRTSKKKGTPASKTDAAGKVAITPTEFEDVEETTENVGDFRFLQLYNDTVIKRMEWLIKGSHNKPEDPD